MIIRLKPIQRDPFLTRKLFYERAKEEIPKIVRLLKYNNDPFNEYDAKLAYHLRNVFRIESRQYFINIQDTIWHMKYEPTRLWEQILNDAKRKKSPGQSI